MTTITPTPVRSETAVRRHPIRGALWGALFGIGLALLLIGMKWIVVGTIMPFVVFAGGVALGAVWGSYGPAKSPKGPPPTHPSALPPDDPAPPEIPLAPSTDEMAAPG